MEKLMKVVLGGNEYLFRRDQIEEFERILKQFLAHPQQHTLILHLQPRDYTNGSSN